MSIFELYNQYKKNEKELELIDYLNERAQARLEASFMDILNCFEDGSDDLFRELSKKDIIKLCVLDPEAEVYWIKGCHANTDHPLKVVIEDLRERKPNLFNDSNIIVLQIIVEENFTNLSQLKDDIESCKDLFSSKRVYFVIKRNKLKSDLWVAGGIALEFEAGERIDQKDMEDQKGSNVSVEDEVLLNNISSDDMVNFIREVVKEYIRKHPGITLHQLQKDFSPIYNGRLYKFVENKQKIEELAEKGDVYHSLAYSDKLDDGTEYVIYKELLSYRHLPKVIAFAKEHAII